MTKIKTISSIIIILLKVWSLQCIANNSDYQDEPYDETSSPLSSVTPVSSSPKPVVLSVPARVGAVFPVRRRFGKKIIPLKSSKLNAGTQLKRARKLNVRKGTINKQFSLKNRQKPGEFQIIRDTKQIQEPAMKSLEKELKTYSEEERQRDLNFGKIFSNEIYVDKVNQSYAPNVDYKRHLGPNQKRDLIVLDKNRINVTEKSRENSLLDSIDRSKLNLSLMAKRIETDDGNKDMAKSNLSLNKKPSGDDDDREQEKPNLILNKKLANDEDKNLKNSESSNRSSNLTSVDYEEEYWVYEVSNETNAPKNQKKSKILRNTLPKSPIKESNANQNIVATDLDSDGLPNATSITTTTTMQSIKTESDSAVYTTFASETPEYTEDTETTTIISTGNTSVSDVVTNKKITTESDDPLACADGSPPDQAKEEANAILRAIQIASKETTISTPSTTTTTASSDANESLGCAANATVDVIAINNTSKDTVVQATEQIHQQTTEADEPTEPTEPTGEPQVTEPIKEDVVAPKRVFSKKDRPHSILKLNKLRPHAKRANNTKSMKSFFF